MSATTPSPITPQDWRRLLDAFDAGLPAPAACRRAGIDFAVWHAESERIREFEIEAGKIETSGLEAAMRFLQAAAASEWRAALEYVKLYYSLRGREVVRVDERDPDGLEVDIAPEAVAAVMRFLRGREDGGDGVLAAEMDGHHGGRPGANGTRESAR
jgi:hypothetical protein